MKPLSILFVTPSYKPAYIYGGPTVSMSELAEALVTVGHKVTVYTTTANGAAELDVITNKPINIEGVEVWYFKRLTKDHTHVSPALWQALTKNVDQFSIIHLHSWWSVLIVGAAWILKFKRKKFILSPRGMLGSYSFIHQHNLLKRALHWAVGRRLLQYSYLHATTRLEWDDCQKIIPGWDGFVLHNLVRLPAACPSKPSVNTSLTIGFLSRIDPKKGLEMLFKALAKSTFGYRLRLAGDGDLAYIQSLKSLAAQLGIADHIEWCGWMSGEQKFHFLRSIDIFVLPSYNENFAMAVVEALAVGTPVVVSKGVGLADYVLDHEVGLVSEIGVDSIAACMQRATELIKEEKWERSRLIDSTRLAFDSKKLALAYSEAYLNLTNGH